MDFIMAESRCKRRRYQESIVICDDLLSKNPKDENAQILKCQCMIKQNLIDQLEFEDEGIADLLLQDNPNLEMTRVKTSVGTSHNPIMHPSSRGGRIASGYQRPGTSQQGSRAGNKNPEQIMSRAGRANPVTSSGRLLRIGTASLIQSGDNQLFTDKLDLKAVSKKKGVSRVIWKYLFYVDRNLKRALELGAFASEETNYKDPWWKVAIGKCYYFMGLLQEAERQFASSVKHNNNIESFLYLSRIQSKRQQATTAIDTLISAQNIYPNEPVLALHIARIYQATDSVEKAFEYFNSVLDFQNCNLQAVASIAAYYFYKDQAEDASRLYQRLIELGMGNSEVWNNVGLCSFKSGRYQLFYSCFERALTGTSDQLTLSDIWYNLGCIYVNLGNADASEMCLRTSIVFNSDNAQSLNNLAVLASRSKGRDEAIAFAERSYKCCPEFDSAFNLSIWYFQAKDIKNARFYNLEALRFYPLHYDSLELGRRISMVIN